MNMKKLPGILIMLLPFFSFCQPISPEEKAAVLEQTRTIIRERYVLPETAEQTANALELENYEGQSERKEFLRQLNKDLRDASQDKHLEVYYDPEQFANVKQEQQHDFKTSRGKPEKNHGFTKLEILPDNVGYLKLEYFEYPEVAERTAEAAMAFLSNSSAVIIDLRGNTGGSKAMVQLIASYFFGNEPVHLLSIYGRGEEYYHVYTEVSVNGKRMPEAPVFILTNRRTFSAAEMLAFALQRQGRAAIIGETTAGGGHTVGNYPLAGGYLIVLPVGRIVAPGSGEGWEKTGVQPDTVAPAGMELEKAYLSALETIMAANDPETDTFTVHWQMALLRSQLEPPTISETVLQSYAGNYGRRIVRYENGRLLYQGRAGIEPAVLLPVDETTFRFDEVDYFRVRFVKDKDGRVTGLKGLYNDGYEDWTERDD